MSISCDRLQIGFLWVTSSCWQPVSLTVAHQHARGRLLLAFYWTPSPAIFTACAHLDWRTFRLKRLAFSVLFCLQLSFSHSGLLIQCPDSWCSLEVSQSKILGIDTLVLFAVSLHVHTIFWFLWLKVVKNHPGSLRFTSPSMLVGLRHQARTSSTRGNIRESERRIEH